MATRFWVGGTGTWDSTSTTHWSASTGGANGATAPVAGDNVTFDASSGGGTVTVDATVSGLSLAVFTAGAFTGTIDFSVNNPNMTFTSQMVLAGSGARKFLMGTGTFTFTAGAGVTTFDLSTVTNLDALSVFNTATYTFTFAGSANPAQNISLGGKALGALVIGSHTNGVGLTIGSGGGSVASMTVSAGANVVFGAAITVVGALTINGTVSSPCYFGNNAPTGSNSTITLTIGSASITGAAIRNMVFSGAAVSATNSFDLGGNNMNGGSISAPSTGGGSVGVIGG